MRGLAPAEKQARAGKLLGEASAVTFHFIWVHQEKFNAPYVEAMGAASDSESPTKSAYSAEEESPPRVGADVSDATMP